MTAATIEAPAVGPVAELHALLGTPERFRRWLTRQPAKLTVGLPESVYGCPLATYLRSEGVVAPAVGPGVVRWGEFRRPRDAPRYPLPDWAEVFVRLVDRNPNVLVSATYALTLLHEAVAA